MEQYEKKGYLNSEFRLFHLTDQDTKEIDYHYHDLIRLQSLFGEKSII